MTRLNRKESQAHTRQALIESARECFARSGYGGTSVDEIAENSNYSKGAFYSNFESKEEIMLEVLDRHHDEEIQQLRRILDTTRTTEELGHALDRWGDQRDHQSDGAKLNYSLQLHAGQNKAFAAKYVECLARYKAAIAELICLKFNKYGLQLPAPAEDLAAALIALADGLAIQQALDPHPTHRGFTGAMIQLVSSGWLALAEPDALGRRGQNQSRSATEI